MRWSDLQRESRLTLVCIDAGRVEPRLRVDGAVNVAVLHSGRIELEMQMRAEGTARLSHVADDLAGLHRLAGTHREGGHVGRHGGHAVRVPQGDVVAGPVA